MAFITPSVGINVEAVAGLQQRHPSDMVQDRVHASCFLVLSFSS